MNAASFSPGHTFGGRFQILEVLGVGHTTEVYLALDLSLNRQVVVKCLVPSLEAHMDIRTNFRTRANEVARLQNPHIARVLDGLQEDQRIITVSEYLPDGSLEDALARGLLLTPEDTARLGRDIASALAEAHEHGLVHGELTPEKLLFDAERLVRVSDLATAGLGVAFRTYTTGEDVRYFSPEQARGEVATPATDVYALALILFEAATGQRPFEGFSAEATLRSRAVQALPSRPELGTLDMLLALASVPEASVRLSAAQFAERLSSVMSDTSSFVLPRTAPQPILSAFSGDRRTSVGFQPPSAEDIVGAPLITTPPAPVSHEPVTFEPDVATGLTVLQRRRRRRPGYLVAALSLVVLAGVGAGAWALGYFTTSHTLPSVEGLTIAQASSLVKSDGVTIQITGTASSSTVPANDIISQVPAAGSSITQGSAISVIVSSGPKNLPVTLPTTLVGASCASATSTLAALNVHAVCPANARVASSTVAVGLVASVTFGSVTNPATVPSGATVVLRLSAGAGSTAPSPNDHGPRAVPNLVGDNQAQVHAALHAANLYYASRGPGQGTTLWKRVVSQSPAAGTMVPWHSTVIINVDEK